MVLTKRQKQIFLATIFLVSIGLSQAASAYHEHQVFYDNPYYYSGHYTSYPYYTHHQYHVIAYQDHYARYNRYYYYQPISYAHVYPSYGGCKYSSQWC